VYCEPIALPADTASREDFGLRAGATLFWCCQSLYKYRPKHDELFPRIARAAGDCQFVFIEEETPAIGELFRERLSNAFLAHDLRSEDHCRFLPRLEPWRFLAAASQCHVFLDSIDWNGCNTTLESLTFDMPVVTLEGAFMRGRHGVAILRRIGVTETIARDIDEYITIAARLATDPAWHDSVRRKIAANKHLLYRDHDCIAALEDFLDRAVREA
jgi:predicted O-linked N-acetylglucosamine transferase (SPINDLY family)